MYHCTYTLGKPSHCHNIKSITVDIHFIVAPMISLVHICTHIAENKTKKSKTTTITIHVYVTVDNMPLFLLFMPQPINYMDWLFCTSLLPFPKDKEERDEEKCQISPITIHKLSMNEINLIHSHILLFCNWKM